MTRHLFLLDGLNVSKLTTPDVDQGLIEVPNSFIYEGDFPTNALYFLWDESTSTITHDINRDKIEEGNKVIQEIEDLNRNANLRDFTYLGKVFKADKDSIQAVQNQCLTLVGTDPIPTPNGQWILSNDSAIGMTVAEFMIFATAFFMRGSDNFGVKTFHKNNINAIVANSGLDVTDIQSYDFSTGWV